MARKIEIEITAKTDDVTRAALRAIEMLPETIVTDTNLKPTVADESKGDTPAAEEPVGVEEHAGEEPVVEESREKCDACDGDGMKDGAECAACSGTGDRAVEEQPKDETEGEKP